MWALHLQARIRKTRELSAYTRVPHREGNSMGESELMIEIQRGPQTKAPTVLHNPSKPTLHLVHACSTLWWSHSIPYGIHIKWPQIVSNRWDDNKVLNSDLEPCPWPFISWLVSGYLKLAYWVSDPAFPRVCPVIQRLSVCTSDAPPCSHGHLS